MITNTETTCVVCGEQIFWDNHRWAGVYLLTDGDVCPDVANGQVYNDHTPPTDDTVLSETTKTVESADDRVLHVKSVALGIANVFG